MSQRDRRRDPYPWTWEPVAAVLASMILILLAGLQLARSLVVGLVTGRWHLSPLRTWVVSTPALLRGDVGAGLTTAAGAHVSRTALWAGDALVETLLLATTLGVLRRAARRWGPTRPHGFASPTQVDRVLGLTRLRRTAHLIRPDLHPEPIRRWLPPRPLIPSPIRRRPVLARLRSRR